MTIIASLSSLFSSFSQLIFFLLNLKIKVQRKENEIFISKKKEKENNGQIYLCKKLFLKFRRARGDIRIKGCLEFLSACSPKLN